MKKSSYKFTIDSNKGLREYNQDACFIGRNKNGQILCVLCDGIGSEEHSEVASRTIVNTFQTSFAKKKKVKNFYRFYNKSVKKSIKAISKKNTPGEKLGSTLCCLLITGDTAEMANIGDSRIYYFNYEESS